ncbi:unnamed protein product [Amoebophrya sp. A120]|nr:unnamed protein product [Amoebophrya sp. A120]|eukprot:GSA120T00025764001.1
MRHRLETDLVANSSTFPTEATTSKNDESVPGAWNLSIVLHVVQGGPQGQGDARDRENFLVNGHEGGAGAAEEVPAVSTSPIAQESTTTRFPRTSTTKRTFHLRAEKRRFFQHELFAWSCFRDFVATSENVNEQGGSFPESHSGGTGTGPQEVEQTFAGADLPLSASCSVVFTDHVGKKIQFSLRAVLDEKEIQWPRSYPDQYDLV